MALEQDSNGFLVGTVITDIKRSRKNSDALLIEVKKIADLLKQQGHLQGNAGNSSSNPPSNTNANAGSQGQGQQNNSGSSSNSSQSESSSDASSELNGNSEQPEQRRESLRQKRERQRRERQQQRLSQQEQQADSQADLTQNPPIPPTPSDNSDSEQSGSARQRDANGRFTSESNDGSPEPIIAGEDNSRGRDSRGRFSGGGAGSSGGNADLEKDGGGNGLGGLIGGLGDRITAAITAGQELQEVDPTIKAFQEVAEPLQRGYQFIFAGSSKKDKPYFAWFNKIWKSLKKTEENTAEQGDSGFSIMGLITTLVMAGVGAWALFSKEGQGFWKSLKQNFIDPVVNSIGNWLKESSGFNAAVDWTSQNIIDPIMPAVESWVQAGSALLTNIGTAWDLQLSVLGAAWDIVTTTIAEVFKVAAVAFTALWTPVASMVLEGWGAVVEFFSSTIFPAITAGWDKVTSVGAAAFDYIAKAFDSVIEFARSAFGFISENWNKVAGFVADVFAKFSGFMKDKFGIDIPAAVSVVTNKVSEIGQSATNAASEAKQTLADKIMNVAQPVLDQAAIAKQNITDTVDKESKSVVDAADKNSKATEKTASAMDDYLKKLSALASKIGGGAMDAVAGTANASEGGNVSGGDFTNKANLKGNQAENMKGVYSAYVKAGLSDQQARVMTAQVGRENDYNGKLLFGHHIDPHNNAENTGMLSWQGSRGTALRKRLEAKGLMQGGKIQQSQEALDEQARFSVEEMRSGGYKGLGNFLDNKNVDYSTGSRQTGKGYVKWRFDDPKYAHHKKREAGYYNKLNDILSSNTATTEQITNTAQKQTVLATPEQVQNAMPKAVQPVSAMPSVASISPIPSVTTQSAKMPEMPSLVLPLSNNVKSSPTTIIPDVGQTVSDQHIAQISYPYATSMGNNKG